MNDINKGNGRIRKHDDDLVVEGFERLDPKYVFKQAPKIKWGEQYLKWPSKRRIEYLEKLASSMNHAASILQDERNELNRLIILKEQQLTKLSESLRQNNDMIQQQIGAMNEERQSFNAAAANMKAEIRQLTKDLNDIKI